MGEGREHLIERWVSVGIDPGALDAAPDGTIRARPTVESEPVASPEGKGAPPIPPTAHTPPRAAPPSPGAAPKAAPGKPSSRDLDLGELIGEGGMGRVWVALQATLAREVAVKGLRAELDTDGTRAQLLREARVTGALEHPNVIPVHTLVTDDSGAPLMVMKRIEGTAWSDALATAERDATYLDTQVRVLMQVCQAMAFAHERGVLHRDLKPDNVMLGRFGETYVVDWGIAVALHADTGIPGLPVAAESDGIVGTIQYMAPEMAGGVGADLDARSDVYLLGAMLYEVLTGQPPHVAERVQDALFHAWKGAPPELPEDVPDELARICAGAMHAQKERRPTASELHDALEGFLLHRASSEIAAEAERRLAAGRQLLARELEALPALREAHFGFRQALRSWPQNPRARAGLQDVLDVLMKRALAEGAIESARELLGEMDHDTRERWQAEVDERQRERDAERSKIQKLEADAFQGDLGAAARARKWFGIGFGVVFFLVNAAMDFVDRAITEVLPWQFLFATSATAVFFAAPALLRRRVVFPNRITRRLGWGLAVMLLSQVLTFGALLVFEAQLPIALPLRTVLAITLFPLAGMIGVSNALIEPRMIWSALLTFGCATLALAWPAFAFYGVGLSYGAFFIGGALLSFDDDADP